MKLVVNNIYIFSLKERKAFHATLKDGINFITSHKENGNKRGKSIIMKSIYSTLGADCIFESSWNFPDKTTVLDINIDEKQLYFVRANDFFKVVDSQFKEIISTNNRKELALKLKELYKFHIELPNRNNELEITPPVYMYLLNYVDQVGLNCTRFSSFRSLEQYANYKKYALLGHFGVFNQEYYDLDKKQKEIHDRITNNQNEIITMQKLLDKLNAELSGTEYSLNTDSLSREVELTKNEYEGIVKNLNYTKNQIIKLENSKLEIENILEELKKDIKDNNNNFKKYENEICPYCNSHIKPFEFSYKYYDKNDNYLFINQSIVAQLTELKRNIQIQEEKYKKYINDMNNYNRKIESLNSNISDILKHKGYIEMRNKLTDDIYEINKQIAILNNELKEIKKKIKEYTKLKKEIDDEYFSLMSKSREVLNLQEIDLKNLEKIDSSFEITGSTRPISTIAWYLTLLKIKYKFNANSIKFPIVLDSPNNAELDDENISKIFKYILNNVDRDTQIIISTIEFSKELYPEYEIKNVITLTNQPYHLLNEMDYINNIDLYKKIMNI